MKSRNPRRLIAGSVSVLLGVRTLSPEESFLEASTKNTIPQIAAAGFLQGGGSMRTYGILILLIFLIMFPTKNLSGQERSNQPIAVHDHVRLIESPIPATVPEELRGEYLRFLPLFEEVVRETTADQSLDCELTIRVEAGVKKIGSKQTQRATARVTAFRKNAKREFFATLILHSYATGGAVNKAEIARFLKRRILGPAQCRVSGASKTGN
jgi:hypothetical protein